MEGKYAVKLSITDLVKISRKWRKRYNGRLRKMQKWSGSSYTAFSIVILPFTNLAARRCTFSSSCICSVCSARVPSGACIYEVRTNQGIKVSRNES